MAKDLIIFTTDDGKVSVNTQFDAETVWLSLDQMAELFERNKSTISRHINNLFEDGELSPEATIKKFLTVRTKGKREVKRLLDYYNLDMAKQHAELEYEKFHYQRIQQANQQPSEFEQAVKHLQLELKE